jgi:hypothetical protein
MNIEAVTVDDINTVLLDIHENELAKISLNSAEVIKRLRPEQPPKKPIKFTLWKYVIRVIMGLNAVGYYSFNELVLTFLSLSNVGLISSWPQLLEFLNLKNWPFEDNVLLTSSVFYNGKFEVVALVKIKPEGVAINDQIDSNVYRVPMEIYTQSITQVAGNE